MSDRIHMWIQEGRYGFVGALLLFWCKKGEKKGT